METPDFFSPQPIAWDAASKSLIGTSAAQSQDLTDAIAQINAIHRSLQQLDPPSLLAPPPPQPPFIQPKRSQQIAKLRESAQTALKKQTSQPSEQDSTTAPQSEAIKLYSLALEMALGRPTWEPQQLLREDVASIYTSRANAYASLRAWADAYTDCRLSLEAKPQANPGAYRVGCDALREMGRSEEAGQLIRRGVAQEEATMGMLRQQVAQMQQQNHPGVSQAKQSLAQLEKELETLREMARSLGIM